MTAFPLPPGRLLTVAEYAALGEDDQYRWELQEGSLVMSPSPSTRHMVAARELLDQLKSQLPHDVRVIPDVDLDLQLESPDRPGWARRPDLIVVEQGVIDRVDTEGGLPPASDVHLVVEIVSPTSRRMDYVIKRGEYADAGIPHYWILDLEAPVSLLPLRLAGDLGFADDGELTGTVTTTQPYPMTINLDQLN